MNKRNLQKKHILKRNVYKKNKTQTNRTEKVYNQGIKESCNVACTSAPWLIV